MDKSNNKKFTLPQLPYAYNALEPYIDARTMEIHYTKHHQAYIDNLNAALEKHPAYQSWSLEELVTKYSELPADIRETVRNNAGGHYNHSLFWKLMKQPSEQNNAPSGKLAEAIVKDFGSFEQFKTKFDAAAKSRFGSGWAWLCCKSEALCIISTPNQDTPLIEGRTPILALDVWEHAYYLKYQNKRVDYITAWWQVVNWPYVEELYERACR